MEVNDQVEIHKNPYWRCDKFEGDAPQYDEHGAPINGHKVPVEIVDGGDERPTRIWRLKPDGTYETV